MKILITGSLGFIATNLILRIKQRFSHELIGIDSGVARADNFEYTKHLCQHRIAPISDSFTLSRALEGVDMVVHLAALGNVVESVRDPLSNFSANAETTVKLLYEMNNSGVKRLIFSSTGGALMGNTIPPVSEETLPAPISPYGASKLACEAYIQAYSNSYDFSSAILRFGNVYGPHSLHKKGVINQWIKAVLEDKPITIYGSPQSSRDYIHVDDLCDGICNSIAYVESMSGSSIDKFHLANYAEITLKDLAKTLQKVHPDPLRVDYMPARKGEVVRNFAATTKAKEALGFNPKISLEYGVKNLYDWIRKAHNIELH